VQEAASQFTTVGDAAPLPDVMLHPLQHPLRPSRRNLYSVRLVRAEHTNYFYPDFVVCLDYPAAVGKPLQTRLIETKENTKDASRKSRRVPKIYGKVMFVTKDQDQLRIVNDDGSLGTTFDWEDLTPAWEWAAKS